MLSEAEIAKLTDYLAKAFDAPGLRVVKVTRLHGGASRQTMSLDLISAAGEPGGLILRRDPPASLIETERAVEFAAYRTVHGLVPTPQPVLLETDAEILGAPFFLMERVEGGVAASPFQHDPYGDARGAIGRQFFTALGRIATIGWAGTPLAEVVEAPNPDECWRRELGHWAAIIRADALQPQPVAEAAIRRLEANPPAPAQRIGIVHGDYRSGNFLHDGNGALTAILDWEMAHLGDPLEDLAWAMDPLWGHFRDDLVAGMIPKAGAVAVWEQASGLKVDEAALRWWSLFSSLKGLAIWLSSARAFADGANTDPVLAFSGWYCGRRHEDIIARRLAAAPRGGL
jgi:aminoglycoside phosphotransferase (APT) family kinase protein